MKIAVIGSGVSGMGAAWLLKDSHDVVVFEKNSRIGGHTNTQIVMDPMGAMAIDTGFIVHNDRNYPRLIELFELLGVETQPSDMSFSASIDKGRIEYAGDALFAQRSNLIRPSHWRMLSDIVRFNRLGKQALTDSRLGRVSLGEWLDEHRFSGTFATRYLLPMAASIWSSPTEAIRDFSAQALLEFFNHHGLLDLSNRPRWRTVVGGSGQYLDKMAKDLGSRIQAGQEVTAIQRIDGFVEVKTRDGLAGRFDQVVFASHADETLSMLTDADAAEQGLLSAFSYRANQAYLHSDERLMPQRKKAWASWNYLAETDAHASQGGPAISISYWMNRLQSLTAARNYFVTLNPLDTPRDESIYYQTTYTHPVFNQATRQAQSSMGLLQGHRQCWYCGAWMGYGFHEDGFGSAVEAVRSMGVKLPETLEKARIEGAPYMSNRAPWMGRGAELLNV